MKIDSEETSRRLLRLLIKIVFGDHVYIFALKIDQEQKQFKITLDCLWDHNWKSIGINSKWIKRIQERWRFPRLFLKVYFKRQTWIIVRERNIPSIIYNSTSGSRTNFRILQSSINIDAKVKERASSFLKILQEGNLNISPIVLEIDLKNRNIYYD